MNIEDNIKDELKYGLETAEKINFLILNKEAINKFTSLLGEAKYKFISYNTYNFCVTLNFEYPSHKTKEQQELYEDRVIDICYQNNIPVQQLVELTGVYLISYKPVKINFTSPVNLRIFIGSNIPKEYKVEQETMTYNTIKCAVSY